jgi:hypothetical protein
MTLSCWDDIVDFDNIEQTNIGYQLYGNLAVLGELTHWPNPFGTSFLEEGLIIVVEDNAGDAPAMQLKGVCEANKSDRHRSKV